MASASLFLCEFVGPGVLNGLLAGVLPVPPRHSARDLGQPSVQRLGARTRPARGVGNHHLADETTVAVMLVCHHHHVFAEDTGERIRDKIAASKRKGLWMGGYLIPHPSEQNIRVRHRYPAVPWEWSSVTPDFVLPVDALARESLRWVEKPGYNRVFVSGQDVGVLGQVTRAGTAGDILAPMVVNALITEAAAARQRGIAVLADTGQQIEVSLRLPVLAETGIIEPGTFVAYQDGNVARLGIVRSTQVEAGMPEVWQTLGVQSHV